MAGAPKKTGCCVPAAGQGCADLTTGRLDSWKEIAAYLRRGARTVQRWEREEDLPVHRLRHEKAETVYAYKAELDAWWASRGAGVESRPAEARAYGSSIAVLPFSDMSSDHDQQYFCEGVAEEVMNALSRVKGLRVASRIAAFQFKAPGGDPREIGQRLRVSTLLQGSVRKAGSDLRITVQFTDAKNGYVLWSARYDREMRDIFAVQDEIARNVVEALQMTLSPKEEEALRKVPTSNCEAYDFYLRGRSCYHQYGRRDIECALQLFSRAVELDPSYALAHAGLADCWSYLYLYEEHTAERRRMAEEASRNAVELDGECAQAYASRGVALSLEGRDQEAVAAFQKAITLEPDLFEAHYFFARHCFAKGELDKAAHSYERAMGIRPEDYQSPLLVAQIYDDLGSKEKARRSRERGVALAEAHLRIHPDDARAMYMAANGLVALGKGDAGVEWAARALRMRPDESMVLYNVGCIYSLLGRPEQALDCLTQAVRNGLRQKGWFQHDSNLDPLRSDPRFEQLMRSLG